MGRTGPRSLTPDEARRAALAAQGFGRRPDRAGAAGEGPPTRAITDVARRLGVVQIDSVNVLVRAHYLPFFSRLGPYSRVRLDAAVDRAPRALVEYWGHEAALIPVTAHPLFRWRMDRARDKAWAGVRRVIAEHPGLVEEVAAAVHALGPVTITDLERAMAHDGDRSREGWGWNWSLVKRAVEYLFWTGEITSAGRDSTFRRRYAPLAAVLPRAVLDAPTPTLAQAHRALVLVAARAQGVATLPDLADHFRLARADVAVAIEELVGAGELVEVSVAGWPRAWARPDLRVPRRVPGAALLAPFDPLIWFRARTERIFGMRYRIGIYTPAEKREHGYYVLPFLSEGHLVARVDLKADRAAGRLLVQSAHREPALGPTDLAALAAELRAMAGWLGLDEVQVRPAGELAADLTGALRAHA